MVFIFYKVICNKQLGLPFLAVVLNELREITELLMHDKEITNIYISV